MPGAGAIHLIRILCKKVGEFVSMEITLYFSTPQTSHWACVAANLPGHISPQVLETQGAKGRFRQAGPRRPEYRNSPAG